MTQKWKPNCQENGGDYLEHCGKEQSREEYVHSTVYIYTCVKMSL